ncbi:hypothetical protein QUF80_07320 [Desulfococcaceae bacterium HSG8]|nr:hypothetical protein [Desulfococcaceae bacterium HSG8]
MNFIYILSEDDNDDAFYKGCIEKMTGKSYDLISRRLRRGGGVSQVRKYMPILLRDIRYTGHVDNTFFVIALDNDRSPAHPNHEKPPRFLKLPKKEQGKTCRFCEIERIAVNILDIRENWPIRGAIAVPVQMMESWLLLICDGVQYQNEAKLPIFAKKRSSSAQLYYGPRKPGDQLKDLCKIKKKQLNIKSDRDFCAYCAENLIPKDLQKISDSFALFKEQVDEWEPMKSADLKLSDLLTFSAL